MGVNPWCTAAPRVSGVPLALQALSPVLGKDGIWKANQEGHAL